MNKLEKSLELFKQFLTENSEEFINSKIEQAKSKVGNNSMSVEDYFGYLAESVNYQSLIDNKWHDLSTLINNLYCNNIRNNVKHTHNSMHIHETIKPCIIIHEFEHKYIFSEYEFENEYSLAA
jgi:hypothetical protein